MKYLLTVVLLLSFSQANAYDFRRTGSYLLQVCKISEELGSRTPSNAQEDVASSVCPNFIMGVYGLLYNEGQICVPDGVTIFQLELAVVTWLQRHPQLLHQKRASEFAKAALIEAFPC